ncbi:MAG: DUF3046 domain-containing protein [Ruaniaceae bacterium]|nr:DUF3046 domain-containing protein [Ruaniaceae bacterium]
MKHSELTAALQGTFGRDIGPSLARDLVLVELDSRTVEEAVSAGIPPQTAWAALAREMGVPEEFPHRRRH